MILGFVAFVVAFRFVLGVPAVYGVKAPLLGLDRKKVVPVIVVLSIMLLVCIYAIFAGLGDDAYMAATKAMEAQSPEKFDGPIGPIVKFIAAVSGFFMLTNLPPICAPKIALDRYFVPGAMDSTDKCAAPLRRSDPAPAMRPRAPAEPLTCSAFIPSPRLLRRLFLRYFQTKVDLMMKMNAAGWFQLSLAQFIGVMMAPDLSVYGPMILAFNLYFCGLFMYNIANAATYDLQVPPALAYLFIVGFSAGAVFMGMLMA